MAKAYDERAVSLKDDGTC
uniref:Uncharacterized protein n=1 Tax=Anguilla anguilla TaxID=7936 RepID=A0A0E9RIN7_ANGAN